MFAADHGATLASGGRPAETLATERRPAHADAPCCCTLSRIAVPSTRRVPTPKSSRIQASVGVRPDASSENSILYAISRRRIRPMASSRAGMATTMEHRNMIVEISEGRTQAACSCGWRSAVFGADKSAGTMDALQEAAEARDLHEWDQAMGG